MGLKVGSVSTHFVSSNTQYAMALKEQLAYLVQYAIRKKAPKYAVAQYAAYTVWDTHATIAHSTTNAAAPASPTQAAVPSPSHPDTDPSAWRSSSASRILSPDTEALAAQAVRHPDGRLTEPDLRMFTCHFPP